VVREMGRYGKCDYLGDSAVNKSIIINETGEPRPALALLKNGHVYCTSRKPMPLFLKAISHEIMTGLAAHQP